MIWRVHQRTGANMHASRFPALTDPLARLHDRRSTVRASLAALLAGGGLTAAVEAASRKKKRRRKRKKDACNCSDELINCEAFGPVCCANRDAFGEGICLSIVNKCCVSTRSVGINPTSCTACADWAARMDACLGVGPSSICA
jgi:hypothetical protein